MKIAAAQLRPKWLDRTGTTGRVLDTIASAAAQGIELVVFPEAFLSGYPFWLCRTDGASFDSPLQRLAYAQFLEASVEVESEEIRRVVEAARDHRISVVLGINERGRAIGRGSIYCSLLTIHANHGLLGVHRKLIPTHDERLCWSHGDARGLKVHSMAGFRVGGLCCWENWMPPARFALYCGGEDLHISVWPGNAVVAEGIVGAIAREGRVWSLSVHGLLSMSDIPDEFVFKDMLIESGHGVIFNGGSSLVAPDGTVVIEPVMGTEGLISHEIDLESVRQNRQAFDVSGHYHRPDIFRLQIDDSRFDESSLWKR
jgi:nitrilase